MTVSAGTTKTTQNCNGSLTDFSFNFAIYGEDDIAVIIRNTTTEVEHLLVLNTDYTVASDDFANGGTVSTIQIVDAEVVPWAIPTGYSITIMLNLALVQETDFLYGGNFSSEAYELTVDRLTRIAQQLSETINRTLKLRKTSAQENIEIDDLEAGKFVVVNDAGNALEMGTVTDGGGGGGASVANDPYNKHTWDGVIDVAASKNVIRDELFNNRLTKGATYAMILALGSGSFLGLPVSNEPYSALWNGITKTAPSQNAVYDKLETLGASDVAGPAANTDDYVPQWNGADSKTLKNGFPITAMGKELINDDNAITMRTTLELGNAALRTAEDTMTDGANLPDGHAIKTYGDTNWGEAISGPASAVDNGIPTFNGTTGKILQDTTRLIEDTLTDGSNLPDGAAIKTYGDANWGGYTNLTEFIAQTAWRIFYSNTDGDITELALGTAGQYLKSGGAAVAPSWDTPAGAGDVVGPATNTDDYVPQWNGANSKTLKNGFLITATGKSLVDDMTVAAMRSTLELDNAALRAAEDTLTDGANLPDGAAIKTYGDANWGGYTNLTEFITQTAWRLFYSNTNGDVTELALGTSGQYLKSGGATVAPSWDVPAGAGDMIGPATNTDDYVPQWNGADSKTLENGFAITAAGKNLLDDATTAAMRTTLELGNAALRAAEDTLTDGANLPDGHAVKVYGDTNWSGTGDGDVVGPATNTDDYVPQWNGADSKTLKNGFTITTAGKNLIDDTSASAMRNTLGLGTAALRVAEDTMTNGSNLPDGAAIKTYGDANWGGGGSGDVVGPSAHMGSYVPQWNTTPNSKTLVEGFVVTAAGKNFLDDATTAAQRSTLGLGSAALRVAEDTMTNGSNLPDGAAIKTYGDANWGGSGSGDVVGPATNTDDFVPQWNGPNSKTLRNGFAVTAAGQNLLDDADSAAMRNTLGLGSAALRAAEDTLTNSSYLPDGHAIITYGNANWGGSGSGDVVGPANHSANYVPQWNNTPNSKTLVAGFLITQAGKNFLDDATTAAQRSTLGLGSAALRVAQDTMTDGSYLPDGHAIISYGNANWGGTGSDQWQQHTGYQAGQNLTSGTKNTLAGYRAGYTQTGGTGNTCLGREAGYSQTIGNYNTSIGWEAGRANYRHAGRTDTNGYGDFNTFVGTYAGRKTYGGYNTAVGHEAAHYLCSGYDNTCIGLCAGRFMGKTNSAGGNYNCFVGSNTGIMQNSGDWNTYLGTSAGYGSFGGANPEAPNPPQGTGSFNTIVGGQSARLITSGQYNVTCGYLAAYYLTSGQYNTFLGRSAGQNCTSGSSNIAIGSAAGASITTLTNATCIGANSNVTISNALVLGSAGVNVGITKTNPTCALDITGQIRTTGNISSGYNISVPTNRSVLLDGEYGTTGFYYDGAFVRLVKAGVVVETW